MARPPTTASSSSCGRSGDRKSTRLNSSHTVIYTLSLHDALPIFPAVDLRDHFAVAVNLEVRDGTAADHRLLLLLRQIGRSEEHTSELQSHSDLHSFPTRRSSDLPSR